MRAHTRKHDRRMQSIHFSASENISIYKYLQNCIRIILFALLLIKWHIFMNLQWTKQVACYKIIWLMDFVTPHMSLRIGWMNVTFSIKYLFSIQPSTNHRHRINRHEIKSGHTDDNNKPEIVKHFQRQIDRVSVKPAVMTLPHTAASASTSRAILLKKKNTIIFWFSGRCDTNNLSQNCVYSMSFHSGEK